MARKQSSNDYLEYSRLRKEQQETQKELILLRAELLKLPQDDTVRANLDRINKTLSNTPCLDNDDTDDTPTPASAGSSKHTGGSNRSPGHTRHGQTSTSSDRAGQHVDGTNGGEFAGASVHIDGLTTLSGVPFDYNVSPLNLQKFKNSKDSQRPESLAIRQDEIVAWQTRERKKAAMYVAVRDDHVKDVLESIEQGDLNNIGCCIETVRLLVQKELAVDIIDKNGRTLLHWVCEHGHSEDIATLINKGWSLNLGDTKGQTPLHLACIEGHRSVVKALINHGVDINMVDNNGRTALRVAIEYAALQGATEKEHICIAETLLTIGASLTCGDCEVPLLHIACSKGFSGLVLKLIDAGADVTVTDDKGLSAIHLAIANGHREIVEKLIELPAVTTSIQTAESDLLHDSDADKHLVYYSIMNNQDEIAEIFIRAGVDTNLMIDSNSILHTAVCRESIQAINALVQKGVDVNAENKSGMSPLHCACITGHMYIIRKLVEAGADVNKTNQKGRSPLFVTCNGMGTDMVGIAKYLLQRGADLRQTDVDGRTVLHQACLKGVSLLVKEFRGADIVGVKDKTGQTALMIAERKYQEAVDNKLTSLNKYRQIIKLL